MNTSRLALLPSELRNRIYTLILTLDRPITADVRNRLKILKHSSLSGQRRSFKQILPLLYTCKQIHAEASSIFYGNNSFNFRMSIEDGLQTLNTWLDSLGEQACHLRDVSVSIPGVLARDPEALETSLAGEVKEIQDIFAGCPKVRLTVRTKIRGGVGYEVDIGIEVVAGEYEKERERVLNAIDRATADPNDPSMSSGGLPESQVERLKKAVRIFFEKLEA